MADKKRVSRLRIAYLLVTLVFIGAWAIAEFGDDRNWIVAIAGTGITGLVVPPMLVAVTLLAIRRRWVDFAVCSVLTVTFLVLSGQVRWAAPVLVADDSKTIRVMSFNVVHGWHGTEKIAKLVRENNVDAFAFQELGNIEDKDAIAELQELLPDYRFFSDGSRTSGTRLKVLRERAIPLTNLPYSWTMIEQVVEFGGKPVRVLNVHAPSYLPDRTFQRPFSYWFRRWAELSKEQTDLIESEMRHVSAEQTPTVLCGDFNMTPVGRRYRLLASAAADCFAEVGAGAGWSMPAGFPMRRIDYIWAFPGLKPVSSWVVDYRASDHAAVMAVLAFKG